MYPHRLTVSAVFIAAALAGLVSAAPVAKADPTGTYSVVGTNAGNGSTYRGRVTVRRTGDTYAVVWDIGGNTSVGTGIGARFVDDRIVMGPATAEDAAISVGYKSGDSFGVAMYFEQPDGSWMGVWTYGGSKSVTSEQWTRN